MDSVPSVILHFVKVQRREQNPLRRACRTMNGSGAFINETRLQKIWPPCPTLLLIFSPFTRSRWRWRSCFGVGRMAKRFNNLAGYMAHIECNQKIMKNACGWQCTRIACFQQHELPKYRMAWDKFCKEWIECPRR